MRTVITVPAEFAANALARDGEAGRQWIEQLPELVAQLCDEWELTVDGAVMHGYLGLVVPVRRGEEPCVLKVSWRDESTLDETTALRVWAGRGAVQVLAENPALGALLLERLDATRSLEDIGIEEAITVAGGLLRRLAIPAPTEIRTLASWADAYCQGVEDRWERAGRPFPRQVLEQTRTFARERGPQSARLLVNHDLHYANVLAGAREPWLVIDPKIIAGDPEFGIAQLLWRRSEDIRAHGGLDRQFAILVDAAALDEELARRWTLVRTVDYWLWGLSVGFTEDPARCKAIAEWLV